MPRVTDESVIRDMVIEAFRQPTGEIVVARDNKYPINLCKQLALEGVDKGKVCRVVNTLVSEGLVIASQTQVHVFGSQSDPIRVKATRYDPAPSLITV